MARLLQSVCAVVLLFAAGAAAEEEASSSVGLEWVTGQPAAYASRLIELKPAPDVDDWALVGSLPFGGEELLLLRVEKRDDEYVLLIDRDFDGDLKREKPVGLSLELPDADALMSEWMDMKRVAVEELRPPWATENGVGGSVRIQISSEGDPEAHRYRIVALLHRRGRVVMQGRTRMVTVYDGDGDLRYDDPEKDFLFLDTDGDRSITMGPDSLERVRSGKPIRVRNESYVGVIEGPFAGRVRFAPSAVQADVARPWTREESPPVGRRHEGEARSIEQIQQDYAKLKGSVKRGRNAVAEMRPLIDETGRVGSDEALAFLQRIYKAHTDAAIRTSVARALGDVRYREGAPFLRRVAEKSGDPDVSAAALKALHRMDAPGRQKFLAGLARKTRDMRVFRAAVLHLAYLGTAESAASLRSLIRSNKKKGARAHEAYLALTRFSPEAPSDDLITLAAQVPHRRLRALAITHAGTLPYPRARDLALSAIKAKELSPVSSAAIVEALGRAGDRPAVKALLDAAPRLDEEARERMVRLLQPVRDPEATALLLAALSAKEAVVRTLAGRIAAGLSDPALADLLGKRICKEEDADARLALAYAIRAQQARSTTPALLRALRTQGIGPEFERVVLDTLMRIGLGDPEVVRVLLERARAAPWQARLRLMDAAADQAEPASAPILVAGLGAERWQVRLVAAQGLQVVRVKEAVPSLIERLEKEEHARVRPAIERALFKTTGMNLYDQVKVWRKWWSEKGSGFAVPEAVGDLPSSDKESMYGAFFGIPVDLQRVIFVIDQSGSMESVPYDTDGNKGQGTDFQRAIRQTLKVIEQLPDSALVNVIFFESDVHAWKDGLVELRPQVRKSLNEHLAKQRPMGATNLYDALEMAVKTPGVETIYVLSDGSPTSGKYTTRGKILEHIADLNWGTRAVIHCVSLGWESDLMRDLAAQNEGTYAVR